jgi:molybdate transport system permease protein
MQQKIVKTIHFAVAAAAVYCSCPAAGAEQRPLLVAVAANFQDVQQELAALFSRQTGIAVEAATGSTGTLFAQIQNGAQFDVFLAADVAHPKLLEETAWGVEGTRFTYATGRLAVFTTSPEIEDGIAAVRDGRVLRLAVANPAVSPYGAAAAQALKAMDLWEAVQGRLVMGESITQALQFVYTGNAEVGFVAYAQVAHLGQGRYWLVPMEFYEPIHQQAILVKTNTPHPAAPRYIEFLQSEEAETILEKWGYGHWPEHVTAAERSVRDYWPAAFDWRPIYITLKLATVTTALLLLFGTPLAWWLARGRSWLRTVIEAIVALPLVLPPTVLGFYLLVILGPRGAIGAVWERIGGDRLVFSFPGLVIGSMIFSLPFTVQPLQNAFLAIGARPLEVAATLRAGPMDRFFTVALPLARRGILTAAVLSFAHTVGEFGVVLMIGGSIPGRTKVVSIAIYDHVETLQYAQAHLLSAGVMVFSFAVLFLVFAVNRRMPLTYS